MSSNRKIKKILLKQEMLLLDLDEYHERDIVYLAEFNQDFADEIAFLLSQRPDDPATQVLQDVAPPDIDIEHLKALHKKLAMATHPDLNPNSDEKFKQVQAAYEAGDGATLIKYALEFDLEFKMSDKDLQQVEQEIDKSARSLEQKRNTVRWAWCQSDKSADLRMRCRSLMGIDEEEYESWLKKKV